MPVNYIQHIQSWLTYFLKSPAARISKRITVDLEISDSDFSKLCRDIQEVSEEEQAEFLYWILINSNISLYSDLSKFLKEETKEILLQKFSKEGRFFEYLMVSEKSIPQALEEITIDLSWEVQQQRDANQVRIQNIISSFIDELSKSRTIDFPEHQKQQLFSIISYFYKYRKLFIDIYGYYEEEVLEKLRLFYGIGILTCENMLEEMKLSLLTSQQGCEFLVEISGQSVEEILNEVLSSITDHEKIKELFQKLMNHSPKNYALIFSFAKIIFKKNPVDSYFNELENTEDWLESIFEFLKILPDDESGLIETDGAKLIVRIINAIFYHVKIADFDYDSDCDDYTGIETIDLFDGAILYEDGFKRSPLPSRSSKITAKKCL